MTLAELLNAGALVAAVGAVLRTESRITRLETLVDAMREALGQTKPRNK